ncbi:MAG: mucoidy inhibitor MuiA family protein [Phycisphaerae bacterium]
MNGYRGRFIRLAAIVPIFTLTCMAADTTRPAGPDAAKTAKALQAAGAVQAVTVYRGQALVTRVVTADAPAGDVELVVTNLPAQIVPDSLFASSEGNVQVRAVRYRAEAVSEEPVEDIRKLDGQIDDVEKALRKIQSAEILQQQKGTYLTNLEGFTAGKVKDDMAKATLDAKTVQAVSDFLFTQRADVMEKMLANQEERLTAQSKLDLLRRQRAELASKFSKTAREAIIFLDQPAAGKVSVRLTYLVNGAAWSPLYNLRAAGRGKDVTLEYNALVQQMSGENWDAVKLTLSTASPNMLSEAPILTPLWVTLGGAPMPTAGIGPESLLGGQRAAQENLKRALEARQGVTSQPARQMDYEYAANEWANRLQVLDLVAGKDVLAAGRGLLATEDTLSVNYPLPGNISIPSRRDQQMIQIAMLKLQGDFYYQAAPVLTPFVYEQADIVNTGDIALLSGPVNSYMDGQFMGTGRVPMVAKGQQFTVGFGVDSQLRVSRELADKTDKIQGGNRELTFSYRLLIDNYKDAPVKVRLLDRLPDPRGADIRVTLGKTSLEISKDEVYLRTLRKSGILRWEVDVPAKSSGAKAQKVEYDYKVEFDKNMHLAEPSPAELEKQKVQFRMELDAYQRMK